MKMNVTCPTHSGAYHWWHFGIFAGLTSACEYVPIHVTLHVVINAFTSPEEIVQSSQDLIRSWQKMPDFPIIQGLRTEPKPGGQKNGFEDIGERISKSIDGRQNTSGGPFWRECLILLWQNN